ncbi:MAG: aromatic ring-hydroxylating dioxygenase subunit alpha [Pseudomonadota bacterium]|nr:aromatic ring-hydroxylating dioxygenase subunit alpha [Pseudomonadota bacterium]
MPNQPKQDARERRIQVAKSIRKRLVQHIGNGRTTDMAERPMLNSRHVYTDPAIAQNEKDILFLQSPIVACFSTDIAAAGDCFVLDDLNVSILITRDSDLRLSAFLNRCSHRGTRLVPPQPGGHSINLSRILCPFHAWCYNLQGNLVAVPGHEGFQDEDHHPGLLNRRHLTPVSVVEHLGLVWIQVKGALTSESIQGYLGEFAPELEQLELQNLSRVHSHDFVADTNWKYALDTYCEGYHFGMLHRDSIGDAYYSNVSVYEGFLPHWRISFAAKQLEQLLDQAEPLWPQPEFNAIHFVFPNTLLVVGNLEQGEMCVRVFRLFPGDNPGTMRCDIAVFAPDNVVNDPQRVAREFAYNDADSPITQEDYRVAIEGYKNLQNAPDDFELVYGMNEPALQAFHQAIGSRLGHIKSRST